MITCSIQKSNISEIFFDAARSLRLMEPRGHSSRSPAQKSNGFLDDADCWAGPTIVNYADRSMTADMAEDSRICLR